MDHEWIKIQSDLEINVPSVVTGQQWDVTAVLAHFARTGTMLPKERGWFVVAHPEVFAKGK